MKELNVFCIDLSMKSPIKKIAEISHLLIDDFSI